jgi:uncharacterized membrane protein YfcA
MIKDLVLLVVGILVGTMNAIAGGGMLIGFPVLVALGLPPLMANATGSLITLPGQLSSAIGYRKYLRTVPAKYAWLLIPGVVGGATGAFLLRHTSADRFKHAVPVLVLFAVLLFAFQPLLHVQLRRHMHGKHKRTAAPLVLIGIGLLPVSFYGGYFGAGYGFMMLAFLSFTDIHDLHKINGMKNVAAVFIAGTSVAVLYSSHLINWRYGFSMAVGTTIGGYVGSRVALKISSHIMRIGVLLIGLVAVFYLGLHAY